MGLFSGKSKSQGESQGSQSAGEGAERAGGTNWFSKKASAGSGSRSPESTSSGNRDGRGETPDVMDAAELESNGW